MDDIGKSAVAASIVVSLMPKSIWVYRVGNFGNFRGANGFILTLRRL
ncbi:MAG: hypothetical protein HC843_13810 [Sphingomonadales bacterium]|nr:hypothetical protein [Sphingomonadales bacterium]